MKTLNYMYFKSIALPYNCFTWQCPIQSFLFTLNDILVMIFNFTHVYLDTVDKLGIHVKRGLNNNSISFSSPLNVLKILSGKT